MVYCGPPSKGCSNCRDRKVRCDQREPGCGQCEKRQQKCPGYRNMVDLMFRDESSHVIKKAQARQRRRVTAVRTPDPVSSSPDGDSPSGILSSSSSSATTFDPPKTSTAPLMPNSLHSRSKGLTLSTPITRSGSNRAGASTPFPMMSVEATSLHQPAQELPRSQHTQESAPLRQKRNPSDEQQQQQQVQPKHEKQQELQQLVWSRDESLLPSPDSGNWPATPMIARIYNLEPTCQERGTAFFFSRYVTMDENVSHQRFDFLYDIWKPGSLSGERQIDGVMASMTAVGLVGISQLTHSKEIIDSARKSYGTALCLTNAALKDPVEALKDTTMLSILILGVFEMMAEPGVKTMKAWHDHLNGAVELAKLRGATQFQTRAGIRMFNMLCQSVTISCLQRHVPMTAEVVALQAELLSRPAAKREPGAITGVDLAGPLYKILQARHDVSRTDLLSHLDILLSRLDDIDAEFERAASVFPADCHYRVLKVTRAHKAVYRDVCLVYPNIATAAVWNSYRTGRIVVLETVLSAIQRHFPDIGENGEQVPQKYVMAFRQAWIEIERQSAAIAASAPQHFGLLNPVNPYYDSLKPLTNTAVPLSTTEIRESPTPPAQSPISSSGSVRTPSVHSEDRNDSGSDETVFDDGGPSLLNPTRGRSLEEQAERHMLLASATNAMVLPLFAIGVSSACTPQLKAYVVARLMAIFDETGLKQARSIASIVRSRELIKSPWLRLFQRPSTGKSSSSSSSMAPPLLTSIRNPPATCFSNENASLV